MKSRYILYFCLTIISLFLFAGCSKKTYNVKFQVFNEILINEQTVEVKKKDSVKKPDDPVIENYQFIGWYLNDELFDFNTPITENITLVSKFEKNVFKITFDENGGTDVEDIIKTPNTTIELPIPTKDGYEFIGWYLNDSLFTESVMVDKDITLVARWEEIKYFQVEFTSDMEVITPTPLIIKENDTIDDLPLLEKKGYHLVGWELNGELFDKNTKITSDITLVAKWEPVKYIINYELNGGINNGKNVTNFTINDETLLYSPIKTGNSFKGWYLDEECINTPISKIELGTTNDITLYAKWERNEFTIIFDTNCEIEIPSIKVKYGDLVEEPEQMNLEGYDFIGWMSIDTMYDFSKPVTKNLKLIAIWEMTEEGLQNYLKTLIPEVVYDNLLLGSYIENCSAELIWSSSNEDVITYTGKVTRLTTDKIVTLSVIVAYSNKQYEYSFDVKVPMIELKPLVKGKIVSGYLADYGSFTGISEKMVQQLDIINYSFGSISNGELKIGSSMKVDKVLAYRKQGVRVVLAVGGWGADGFSQAVRTADTRKKFIDSIMDIIKKYQFDGIDIDWEYPGSGVAGIEYHSSDRSNLTLFCQELKARMMEYREDLLLTIAIAPSNQFYDLAALNKYIDIFNVMTYDFAMGTTANHDSNLYSTSKSSNSMANSVEFVKKYVDADKIIPGAAFYVRRGYFQSANNQNIGSSLSISMGTNPLGYNKFMEMINSDPTMIESYDEEAGAAYMIHNRWFYSYDNPRSIKEKCNYIKTNSLGGLMCWDLTTDYIDDTGTGLLVNAMYEGLK